jgi:hypothetical protein
MVELVLAHILNLLPMVLLVLLMVISLFLTTEFYLQTTLTQRLTVFTK